jgi:hypothetical protein
VSFDWIFVSSELARLCADIIAELALNFYHCLLLVVNFSYIDTAVSLVSYLTNYEIMSLALALLSLALSLIFGVLGVI